uniref:HNH endonuclease 5 domain-containing protein n=1 Tax=viral metagenome TaxID=1070528 RepID=A0A6C0HLQ9_9ZZZZ
MNRILNKVFTIVKKNNIVDKTISTISTKSNNKKHRFHPYEKSDNKLTDNNVKIIEIVKDKSKGKGKDKGKGKGKGKDKGYSKDKAYNICQDVNCPLLEDLNQDLNEDLNKKYYKKEGIPKRVRELVWTTYNGEVFNNNCHVKWCDNNINVFNFQVGHDIPESKGGTLEISNLKPICGNCNLSMGNKYTIGEWNKLVINK